MTALTLTNPMLGMHVKKSPLLPDPVAAEKEMDRGDVVQVTFGVVVVAACSMTEE